MNSFLCPTFNEFSLNEKTRIATLHKRFGSSWNKIAKRLPGRSASEIKAYWLKKKENDQKLREFCRRESVEGFVFGNSNDKVDTSMLEILALACKSESERLKSSL